MYTQAYIHGRHACINAQSDMHIDTQNICIHTLMHSANIHTDMRINNNRHGRTNTQVDTGIADTQPDVWTQEYTKTYMQAQAHGHMHKYTYIQTYAQTQTYACIRTQENTHSHTQTPRHTHNTGIHTDTDTNIQTHTGTNIRTDTHTDMDTHQQHRQTHGICTHIHTCSRHINRNVHTGTDIQTDRISPRI